jgi:hypothetical protein
MVMYGVQIALDQTEGFTEEELRDALYRAWPSAQGGSEDGVRLTLPFVLDEASQQHIETSASFLEKLNAIPDATLPEGAVYPELADKVLAASDDPKWVGTVKAEKG